MTAGDLPASVLFGAVSAAAGSDLGWLVVLAVMSLLALVTVLCWPWADDTDLPDGDDGCWCLACQAAYNPDDDGACACGQCDNCDPLMAPIVDILDGRPVNEPRPDRWGSLDGRNRGAWLDAVSRTSNQQNARWITGQQQEQAGRSLADEVAEFLEAEARRPGETTGEIGGPGRTEPGA
jgi:hypothetical protein